jgi:hypothetical protein
MAYYRPPVALPTWPGLAAATGRPVSPAVLLVLFPSGATEREVNDLHGALAHLHDEKRAG